MLSAKPDFDEARTRWEHFWHGEVDKRPLVMAHAFHGQVREWPGSRSYERAVLGRYDETLDLIDEFMDVAEYLGEAMPSFGVCHGPDQYAAFLGAELKFNDSSGNTNWVDPLIDDWATADLTLHEANPTFQSVLAFARAMAERARGRYLVGPIDAHSHLDTLSALRGPQRLLMDLYDCPEQIDRAMAQVRPLFPRVYQAVWDAGDMGGAKGCSQGEFWGPGKFGVIQCDFIYMIGPEHFRRFALPAIAEEAAWLDQVYFHLDGPGSFRHLDDLLAVPNMGIISVDSGDGQPENHTWVDLFQRILAAGCKVRIYGSGLDLERIKVLHRELGPRNVIYSPAVGTRAEFERICDWLVANT